MNTILKAENVGKSFAGENGESRVLQNISFTVEKGEFVSIMGPSGSGKSTLLYCVSGMDTVSEGRVEFCGQDLSRCGDEIRSDLRRTRMGFVFQQPSLLKNLNVLDNIMLIALRENKKDAAAIQSRAMALMEKAGIAALADRGIDSLSGGQLQRAGVCRALMCAPEILFGDEPTGALNSSAAQEVMEMFRHVNAAGTAILLVTHDAKIAAQSERVILMRDGGIADDISLGKYQGGALEERTARVDRATRAIGI